MLLVACLGASLAVEAQFPILVTALFGLGVGWNFAFVAASTLLQEDLSLAERVRIQGVADTTTWVSSALAAFLSGFVLAASSYAGLSLVAAIASLTIVVALALARRPAPRAA